MATTGKDERIVNLQRNLSLLTASLEEHGWTRQHIADAAGLSYATVQKMTSGARKYSPDSLAALERFFECGPGDMLKPACPPPPQRLLRPPPTSAFVLKYAVPKGRIPERLLAKAQRLIDELNAEFRKLSS